MQFTALGSFRIPALMGALFFALQAYSAPSSDVAHANIYPPAARAGADLAAALRNAAASHRRIILDFGGNWCPDCHVLDSYFHDSTNLPLLDANYVLVHVNVERMTDNLDIASRYNVPLKKGVPALAVLNSHGKLLYSQTTGEFEAMRGMHADAVTTFLKQWRPAAPSQPAAPSH